MTHSVPWQMHVINSRGRICKTADTHSPRVGNSHVPWLIHVCHDSFMCAMTHSCVPWLIHVCHDSCTAVGTRACHIYIHIIFFNLRRHMGSSCKCASVWLWMIAFVRFKWWSSWHYDDTLRDTYLTGYCRWCSSWHSFRWWSSWRYDDTVRDIYLTGFVT